jgi:transcriptional regulator with XRE-family HTH domain
MEFKDRLEKYRKEIGINKKRDMAKKLHLSESFYNLLESGKRPPSKKVLESIVALSGKPEVYWVYGIENEKEYLKNREEFKCLKDAITQLDKIGLLDISKEFNEGVKEVILAAALADVTHIIEKKNSN